MGGGGGGSDCGSNNAPMGELVLRSTPRLLRCAHRCSSVDSPLCPLHRIGRMRWTIGGIPDGAADQLEKGHVAVARVSFATSDRLRFCGHRPVGRDHRTRTAYGVPTGSGSRWSHIGDCSHPGCAFPPGSWRDDASGNPTRGFARSPGSQPLTAALHARSPHASLSPAMPVRVCARRRRDPAVPWEPRMAHA